MVVMMLIGTVSAHAQDIINYFEVADNIAKPVTIKTRLGTFQIYGGERIAGNLYSVEAYDAKGNKIVNTQPYKTATATNKPTVRFYRFKDLYGSSSKTSSSSYSSSSSSNKGSGGNGEFNEMQDWVDEAIDIPMEGYPNLQVSAGASFLMDEYASLKAELGGAGGFIFEGGIGKNIFDNNSGTSWCASIGYYGGNKNFCLTYGMAFLYSQKASDYALVYEMEFSYFFKNVPRFGFYAELQFGAYLNHTAFTFNAGIGISWKLFSK